MLEVIISLGVGIASLFFCDYLGKKNILPKELSRKIPHILIALAVATWPFFVGYNTIIVVSLIVLCAAVFSKKVGLFPNLREVKRLSWGDMFLPVGIIIVALMEPNEWIFATSMLFLGLADPIAALIGTKFGKNKYEIFGHKKTWEGSLAFLLTGTLILVWFLIFAPLEIDTNLLAIVLLPFIATAVEATLPYGLDNLFVPLTVAIFLSL